jgi:hypothetical protein
MDKTNTVIINGRHYDPKTGLPVAPSRKKADAVRKPVHSSTVATSVHASAPQRSQTLNRRVVKKNAPKPVEKPKRAVVASSVHKPIAAGRTMDIARSSHVSRFAAHVSAVVPKPVAKPDHPPTPHPMAERAMKRPQPQVTAKKTLSKEEAIAKVLSAPSPSREPKKGPGFWGRHRRLWIILGTVLIILVVGGYVALVNLPGISVSFAAQQAGIKASYPSYTPDGYSLQQPVTFSDGQVTLNFVSNSGSKGYTISEARSSWDSSAVLVNVVKKDAGSNYITTQDSGLTIYTYDGDAAWVNNSILYTITTKAPLSNEQVRNIATSL